MHHEVNALYPVIILLVSGIFGAALAKLLKLTPIIGFFVAGAVVGPFSSGLVQKSEVIILLGEIGVALLLFDIGLHLSFRKMWRLRHDLFVLGPLQVGSSALIIGLIAYFVVGTSWQVATVIGFGLSLSSTAVVMQMLNEKGQSTNPLGQSITSILVFQDIFIVFLLILVPIISGSSEASLLNAITMGIAKMLGALALVYVIGKFILQPLLRKLISFAREELFTATILLIILTTASFTSFAGLSLPLGAFLAGLIISETEYCYMVKGEMRPFRTLLLGLFFISVGMSLNFDFLMQNIGPISLTFIGLISIKTIALMLVARLQKRQWITSIQMGLWLAQAGEFGFVLFGMANNYDLLSKEIYQSLVMVIGISFLLTPLLVSISQKIANYYSPSKEETSLDAKKRVIIVGFGAEGKNIARILHASGISYVGLDSSQHRILMARAQGFDIVHGDLQRNMIFDSMGAKKARALIFALDNDQNIRKIAKRIKSLYPKLTIFANVIDSKNIETLIKDEIICIAADPQQTGVASARKVLSYFGKDEEEINRVINNLFQGQSDNQDSV